MSRKQLLTLITVWVSQVIILPAGDFPLESKCVVSNSPAGWEASYYSRVLANSWVECDVTATHMIKSKCSFEGLLVFMAETTRILSIPLGSGFLYLKVDSCVYIYRNLCQLPLGLH